MESRMVEQMKIKQAMNKTADQEKKNRNEYLFDEECKISLRSKNKTKIE